MCTSWWRFYNNPLQARYNRILICSKALVILISAALVGCGSGGDENAPVLLFEGTGTSPGDVEALKKLLRDEHLDFAAVSSSRLNGMSAAQIGKHRLLIIPGGNFELLGNNLTAGTASNLRGAVKNGLSYLGICAGAFFAGNSPFNGLNLTSGARFRFYAAEAQGIRKAAVKITTAAGQTLDHYWEDGPQLNGWGAAAALYPDGTAAVSEGAYGNGWVVLSGIHPEAPESWRRGMDFKTPAATDHAYAAALIRAALNRESLVH